MRRRGGTDFYIIAKQENEMSIVIVLVVWLVVSIAAGLLFGRMCRWANGGK